MATKKKSKKKAAKKSSVRKKPAPVKRSKATAKKKTVVKSAKKKNAKKKTVSKKRGRKEMIPGVVAPSRPGMGAGSGGQSGDLQGLYRSESADSESVDELIEEGNAFEADAVKGVEDAGDDEEGEVHTHEELEDDVPGEYLDKD
jgi:hypothetical protein